MIFSKMCFAKFEFRAIFFKFNLRNMLIVFGFQMCIVLLIQNLLQNSI